MTKFFSAVLKKAVISFDSPQEKMSDLNSELSNLLPC